jgi:uncharacterized protein (DUF488 family)
MPSLVYTIGHSTHAIDRLTELLIRHGVTAVCDVRSTPYSRINPQFNREDLKLALRTRGIAYVFLGKELGARIDDPSCYKNGKVQYDRLARTEIFQSGIARVREGTKNYQLALMCAEKEPLDCHRAILVARHLVSAEVDIAHIHANGSLENHVEALVRLTNLHNLREAEDHMFRSREALFADAYRLQEERIAYDTESNDVRTSRSRVG